MRMSEDRLIGWLCIMRHNLDEDGDGVFFIPPEVKLQLVEHGWLEVGEIGWDKQKWLHVTDAGCLVSDLAAPEWGIDAVPVE